MTGTYEQMIPRSEGDTSTSRSTIEGTVRGGALALTVSPSLRWPARRLEGRLQGDRLLLQELGIAGGAQIAFRRLPRPELERLLQGWRGELATARALRAPAEALSQSVDGVKRWTAAVDARPPMSAPVRPPKTWCRRPAPWSTRSPAPAC